MEYPKEFGNLIELAKDEYKGELIGVGNPASNILLIGKEPAIPKEKKPQRLLEIEENCEQWEINYKLRIDISDVPSMDENRYRYNPLYPYKGQKCMVYIEKIVEDRIIPIRGKGGTSKTWYQYQKLWDFIYKGKKSSRSDTINYHEHCFSTELSSANEKYSYLANSVDRKISLGNRKKLLCHSFYQEFPIVILAVGHYPKEHGIDIESIFHVKWIEPTHEVGKFWYNIHNSITNNPKLVIHTNQLSMVSDDLIKEIADRIIEFKNNHNITLI